MGAEIMTGNFIEGINEIQYKKGDIVILLTKESNFLAKDSTKLSCSYNNLASVVQPGQQILVADGTLVLTVLCTDTTYGEIACRIENTTILTECRNMCIPSINNDILMNDLPTISKQDINDILQFIIPTQQNYNNCCIDYISIGHLRNNGVTDDIKNLRQLLTEHNQQHIKIIAKIDTIVSLKQLHTIINVADSIVVNRGELGMNLPTSKVFLAQKYIIHECNIYGKPVCVATQLLNSMITNPRPTRAECSDIANAVLDGADSVLLSQETSIGLYGSNAVKVMVRTICEAESSRKYNALYTAIRNSVLNRFNNVVSPTESLASSAVKTAIDVNAKLIVVLSQSGRTARYIAKYRPGRFIVCLTTSLNVARQTSGMLKGVHSYLVNDFTKDYILAQETGHEAIKVGIAQPGDLMVIVCGNIHETKNGKLTDTVASFANQVRVESITEPPNYNTEQQQNDVEIVPSLPSTLTTTTTTTTTANSPRGSPLSKLQSFRVAYKDDE
jgi:pyruvate kinase